MLHGLGTALITPFTASGQIDFAALERLLDKQLAGQVDYLVVLGTTGEAATMTAAEKEQVCNCIFNKVGNRLPLVLGLGGNCTAQVVAEIEQKRTWLQEHFAAILSVCPYYNKPSQEGLYQHFTTIAQASPIPVILYNVPGRTGVNLLPETVMRIYEAQPDKILGIKEASGNLDQIRHLIQLSILHSPFSTLHIISGDDGIAAEVMQAGGAGLISVASNAWPEEFGQIVRSTDKEQQTALQTRFADIVRLLFKEGNPAGIKTVLSQMGIINNYLRLPLVPNSPEVQKEISEQITLLTRQ
ncbi:MAG: 4-hydroxy-tetrahydrodipicolinate synthase [Paludibacteraceae bacterium]|nr:4-hydroxy-tetrahydrodipicolinate synthase [Paludibacteraceae bacterium]